MWDDVMLFAAVGFVAQLIDGALGMAYGLTGTTVLLSVGVPPATASASVHTAEIFTTAASGISHWRLGNVRWRLLWRLAIPGMIGGAIGAYVLSSIPGDAIRPYVNGYLIVMGAFVLWRALRRRRPRSELPRWVLPLGFGGGFLDAVGGGGWGPMVTSTLVGAGTAPRPVIGSVNSAEFFVTTVISVTFLGTIGLELWPIITGLILGGVVAAPLAAYVVRIMPQPLLMALVGVAIVLLSGYGLLKALS